MDRATSGPESKSQARSPQQVLCSTQVEPAIPLSLGHSSAVKISVCASRGVTTGPTWQHQEQQRSVGTSTGRTRLHRAYAEDIDMGLGQWQQVLLT